MGISPELFVLYKIFSYPLFYFSLILLILFCILGVLRYLKKPLIEGRIKANNLITSHLVS